MTAPHRHPAQRAGRHPAQPPVLHRRLAAAVGVVAVLLVSTGCSTDIRGRPVGGVPQDTGTASSPAGSTTDEEATVDPGGTTSTAAQAWDLAGLTAPDGAETISAVARPAVDDLASYLVVLTTTPEAGRQLCEQLGGRLPVGPLGLSELELTGWGLEAGPPGELGVCKASATGDYAVQRDVLLAEADGTATVWLSTYRLPR